MGTLIAVLNKRDENAAETAVSMLKTIRTQKVEAFGIASPTTIRIEKTLEALQNQQVNSHLIIGHVFSRILDLDKPQPVRLENASLVFEGRTYPPIKKMSDAEAIAGKLKHNCEAAAQTLIKETEGDYAFVIAETSKLIAGRDTMGIRPLYYGENKSLAALASECKALWRIGIEEADSFPPGHIVFADRNGFIFKPVKTLAYSKAKGITMGAAARQLETLLEHSILERISGLKEVAIAFSGGLDSAAIAFLAKRSNANVHLIHVSLENQLETEHAKKAAEELKLPIHVYLFKEENLEESIPKVVGLIEEPDSVKTSIGIPFYWTAEKAAKTGFKVMLAGQGADELFGGYRRYIDYYLLHDDEKTRKKIFEDIITLHETNLERDTKICNFHSVELRLPFVTYKVAEFALDLPIRLKLGLQQDTLRKLVLRRVEKNLGLPEFIVNKPKKAIQYTTGINNILKKIAKRKQLTVNDYLLKVFQEERQKRI
jgi:asparagine synthase (glutamine-hydrolysing)